MATDPRVTSFREVLRHLQQWRSVYECEGVDTIKCPDGTEWSIWDVERILEDGLPRLPPRQRQSILMCLVSGMREADVAVAMGVSITNPVAMYATDGIHSLFRMMDQGEIRGFRLDLEAAS